jgi:hypothetical protein
VPHAGRPPGPRWFVWLGVAAAGLVLSGVLIPLHVPGTDATNFVGYVLWSVWLLAFAVIVWRPTWSRRQRRYAMLAA